jgi:hypothetical protein
MAARSKTKPAVPKPPAKIKPRAAATQAAATRSAATKPAATKPAAKTRPPAAKKPAAKTRPPAAAAALKPAAKTRPPAAAPAKKPAARADLGAPIDGYLARVDPALRPICDALVNLITAAVPGARSELKWGMPVFSTTGMLCYFRAQKGYVRFGFPGEGIEAEHPSLHGEGTGKRLRLASVGDIDRARITGWLQAVARHVGA